MMAVFKEMILSCVKFRLTDFHFSYLILIRIFVRRLSEFGIEIVL